MRKAGLGLGYLSTGLAATFRRANTNGYVGVTNPVLLYVW